MRVCKSLVALLTFFLAALTATVGCFAAQINPKVPADRIFKNFPQITVTAPQSDDRWLIGDGHGSRFVHWTYSGDTGDDFNIALQKGTAIVFKFPGDFPVNGAGKGSAGVAIPDSVSGGDGYRIVVTNKGNPNIKGISAPFSLLNLKITSPQSGAVWYKGETHNITWTYSGNFSPKVYIWLIADDAAVVRKIGEASIGDKYYPWKITVDIERRKNYKIMINNNSSYLFGGDWIFQSHGLFTVAEYVK